MTSDRPAAAAGARRPSRLLHRRLLSRLLHRLLSRSGAAAVLIRRTLGCGTQAPSPHGTEPTAMLAGDTTSTTSGSWTGPAIPSARIARRAAARPTPWWPAGPMPSWPAGTPGVLDPRTGDPRIAVNLPAWREGVLEALRSDLGRPVTQPRGDGRA